MNTLNYKVLPVVDSDGTYKSLLHYNAFAKDVLTILNPEKKIGITTSVDLVCSTLNAQPIIQKPVLMLQIIIILNFLVR